MAAVPGEADFVALASAGFKDQRGAEAGETGAALASNAGVDDAVGLVAEEVFGEALGGGVALRDGFRLEAV